MPARKRPSRSRYNNPFERIDHQFEDQAKELRAVRKTADQIFDTLGKRRKEEKDNGKRIDALVGRVDSLERRIDSLPQKIARELRKSGFGA